MPFVIKVYISQLLFVRMLLIQSHLKISYKFVNLLFNYNHKIESHAPEAVVTPPKL